MNVFTDCNATEKKMNIVHNLLFLTISAYNTITCMKSPPIIDHL